MAVSIITQVISLPLPPTDKLVLIAIADFSDAAGTCFPGRKAIAGKASLSLKTVDRSLKKLVDGGWLTIKKRSSKKGDHTSNFYSIEVEKIAGGGVTVTPGVASESRHPSFTPPPPRLICHLTKEAPTKKPSAIAPHSWFTSWWCHSFEQLTSHRYAYSKKAAGLVKNLLRDLDLEELTARACAYLALSGHERFPKGAPTLEGLTAMVNQLAGKLDEATEERFAQAGLLPDFDETLIDFRPWLTPAQSRDINRQAAGR